MARLTAPFAALLAEKQSHLTRLRQQTDPGNGFAESEARHLWRASGAEPGILSLRPIDATTVGAAGVYRRPGRPFFTQRESRIAHILFTEVPWLHGRLDANDEASVVPALSPRRRTILNLLLDGQSRRRIAEHLGVSVHTANEHVKEVYRHFGAHSQAELIRRFTSGDGGDGPQGCTPDLGGCRK